MILLTLLLFFCLLYIILIFLSIIGWLKLETFYYSTTPLSTSVSIIIAARNEENNIQKCLKSIVSQDYPCKLFEVIVIDDASTDKTVAKINAFIQTNISVSIKLLQQKESKKVKAYKKEAITTGIQNAKGDLIITTDADCIMENLWLKTIVSFYEKEKPKMIVAPVSFYGETTIFEKMQTLECMSLAGIAGASIQFKHPIMCNGANLIYEKNVFIDIGGFQGFENIASGDDMHLMNKIKILYPDKIKYLKSKNAIVYTHALKNLSNFFQQRKRWASKTFINKDAYTVIVAAIVFLCNLFILVSGFLSVINYHLAEYFLIQLLAKCMIDFLFLFLVTSFFKKREFLWYFLLAQLTYPIYIVITGIASYFKKYSWKDRNGL